MKNAKKILSTVLALTFACALFTSCSSSGNSSSSKASSAAVSFKVGMVTDTGGVNDQSFNQSAWSGLTAFKNATPGVDAKYLESTQASDYATNLNQFASSGYNLVWGIGYLMTGDITTAAKAYPNTKFALVDDAPATVPSNLTCVEFKAQESSFLVGYIAALKTKTNKVGFVGGMKGAVIDQFEYGYRAGVAYGAKELGKTITVNVQYANSFSDASLGKGIAKNMYAAGCDIVFSAAGNVGQGVISEATAENKLCIGVDQDQAHLAPNNILTSAMKDVDKGVELISGEVKDGKSIGGQTFSYGLKEDCVGVPYTDQATKMCGSDVLDKTKTVQQKIVAGTIVPPNNAASFATYLTTLK